MASTLDLLEPFSRFHPGSFISQYSDWVLFTILLFLFWSIAGIALRKRFEESRYLRVLISAIALALAVGTYYGVYQGWLHLSFESFGLFGAVLLLVVIFFIIFGLMRSYGLRMSTALPLGFALFYVSLWAVIPNILTTFQETFPPVNGILLILFVVSVFKVLAAFFSHSRKSPLEIAKDMPKPGFLPPDREVPEIEREEKEEKKEMKLLKRKNMKLTEMEIKTVEEIEDYLEQMIGTIKKKGKDIDQEEIAELVHVLRQIGKKQGVLEQGLALIKRHEKAYKNIHKRDISELEKRSSNAKSNDEKRVIEEEIFYQRNMVKALEFMDKYEQRIIDFTASFNKLIYGGMQKLKERYPSDALEYLVEAHKSLTEMKHVYEKQKEFEKYLLKLDKKTIKDLKKEKKNHQ
ncbi:MAG: hypothetical protein JRL30_11100 [Deltaproteobacteria bacterium]|nr:hypothetical protein [Deltaproteobacteria bacterium]